MAPSLKEQIRKMEKEFGVETPKNDKSQDLVLALSPSESQADTYEADEIPNQDGQEITCEIMKELEKEWEYESGEGGQEQGMTPDQDENTKNKIPCIKEALETPHKPRKARVGKRSIDYEKEKPSSKKKLELEDGNIKCQCQSECLSTNLTNFSGNVQIMYSNCRKQFTLKVKSIPLNNCKK